MRGFFLFNRTTESSHCGCLYSHEKWAIHVLKAMAYVSIFSSMFYAQWVSIFRKYMYILYSICIALNFIFFCRLPCVICFLFLFSALSSSTLRFPVIFSHFFLQHPSITCKSFNLINILLGVYVCVFEFTLKCIRDLFRVSFTLCFCSNWFSVDWNALLEAIFFTLGFNLMKCHYQWAKNFFYVKEYLKEDNISNILWNAIFFLSASYVVI